MKVFFLIHSGTVEEQSYLTSLRREKEAFEFLIDLKSVITQFVIMIISKGGFYSKSRNQNRIYSREW